MFSVYILLIFSILSRSNEIVSFFLNVFNKSLKNTLEAPFGSPQGVCGIGPFPVQNVTKSLKVSLITYDLMKADIELFINGINFYVQMTMPLVTVPSLSVDHSAILRVYFKCSTLLRSI